MITGFNTDIDHQGRVFHVQTEDKGEENPVVETLIYSGGEIVTSRRSSYEDLAAEESFSEAEVLRRMEVQHKALIREIQSGKYDTDEEPMPFGHNIVSNRSLDEVALEYLLGHVALDQIEVAPLDRQLLMSGTRPALRLKVQERSTERPICGARVTIRLVSTLGPPEELFSADTDADGFLEAAFDIPDVGTADAAIVCDADAAGKTARFKQIVDRPAPATKWKRSADAS